MAANGKKRLNPQVPLAGGGAVAGYGIGKFAGILLFYHVLGEDIPEHVKTAWEVILEATLSGAGAYFVAWLKGPPNGGKT